MLVEKSSLLGLDILNRAGLGMEVMHERNAHTSLDLAAAESVPVALTAPAIG